MIKSERCNGLPRIIKQNLYNPKNDPKCFRGREGEKEKSSPTLYIAINKIIDNRLHISLAGTDYSIFELYYYRMNAHIQLSDIYFIRNSTQISFFPLVTIFSLFHKLWVVCD